MATHGSEREQQRHQDYMRTEVMSIGERLRTAEERLNDANRRLALVEAWLTATYGPVQSGGNDHLGG